jgi:hypothetical protein
MRLDSSGNLGIGTSSPTFGSGDGVEIQRAGIATLRIENSSASNSFELYADSAANGINLRGRDSSPLVFWTANTERMRLDSSGNLGIGTTSPASRLHVNNATGIITYATIGNINGGTQVGADAAGASVLSSFAVNAIRFGQQSSTTFVETMRLDSSGNLGIGTASPATRIHAERSTDGVIGTFRGTSNAQYLVGIASGVVTHDASNGSAIHTWQTNGTERARLDNLGNLGIGTTSFGTSAATVLGIANGTAPTSSPAGMGQLYVEAGALKYRGSSGTVTTIANA